jgi:hypothetical protein
MAEIAKSTDLSKTEGDPGDRAQLELEQCDMDVALPWIGGYSKLKITTRTRAGVVLICSIATLLLALTGSAVAAIAVTAADMTGWAVLAAALVTPPTYFSLAYLILAHMFSRQARDK